MTNYTLLGSINCNCASVVSQLVFGGENLRPALNSTNNSKTFRRYLVENSGY